MLEINPFALFIQIANFLVLVFLLNKFLFKPIRAILAKRASKLDGLAETIRDFESRAMASEDSIIKGRESSKREGLAEKEILKAGAHQEEIVLIEDAVGESERMILEARAHLEESMISVRESLGLQTGSLSQEVASRILGRSVS